MTRHEPTRRGVLSGIAGAGGAATAVGWSVGDPAATRRLLRAVSRANDGLQAAMFSPTRLAPTYAADAISPRFPFNAFYPESLAPVVDPGAWRLAVAGRVARSLSLSLADLRATPSERQVTRLVCIEGWSAVGSWVGPRLATLLEAAGADRWARYVAFDCADGYRTSIDMASALHPQTIVALDFLDRPLPSPFGFPARLRIPTKLGFKSAKHLERITVTDAEVGGFWEDQGYNWFAGL